MFVLVFQPTFLLYWEGRLWGISSGQGDFSWISWRLYEFWCKCHCTDREFLCAESSFFYSSFPHVKILISYYILKSAQKMTPDNELSIPSPLLKTNFSPVKKYFSCSSRPSFKPTSLWSLLYLYQVLKWSLVIFNSQKISWLDTKWGFIICFIIF